MDVLWAPWRLDYILGEKPDACVFCLPEHTDEDRERLILYRGKHAFVILNKFPYNNGHVMVTPYQHAMCLTELDTATLHEISELLKTTTAILKSRFNPGGVNVGLNLGEAAGAGIREHLHFHLVPRWNGDSNFMAAFSETRVVPEHLMSTYDGLKPQFDRL